MRHASSIKAATGVAGSFPLYLCLQVLSPSSLLSSPSCYQALSCERPRPHPAMAGDDMWHPCYVTEVALKAQASGGLLRPVAEERMPEWLVPPVNDREPNPPRGFMVCFLAFLDRGFGIPASRFMCVLTVLNAHI